MFNFGTRPFFKKTPFELKCTYNVNKKQVSALSTYKR